ncbi:MAG: hypothetical protein ACRCU3_04060 [Eubacteriaceae bacterium]
MTNKKKWVGILSLGLVAVLAVAGTLAYLTAIATPRTNAFTFVDNTKVAIEIEELDWDSTGEVKAGKIYPGMTIEKDPALRNTSTVTGTMDVYGAIRVTWTDGTASPKVLTDAEMLSLITTPGIGYIADTVSWEAELVPGVDASTIYYYTGTIAKGAATNELFETVTIPSTITNAKVAELVAKNGFKIQVEGAAIQAEGLSYDATTKAALKDLFPAITAGGAF